MHARMPPPDGGGALGPPDATVAPVAATRIAGTAGTPLRSLSGARADTRVTRTWLFIGSLVFVVALVLGREIFVPVALAGVFSILLAPLADRGERLHLGRTLSAVLSVLLLVGAFAAVSWIAASQVADLAQRMPEYARNIRAKFGGLGGSAFGAPFARAMDGLKRLEGELSKDEETSPSAHPSPPAVAPPTDVHVVAPPTSLVETVTSWLGPMLAPFGSALMVVLLTVFFLAYRADLRNRMIRLVSRGHIELTARAFDDASRRLSRYLGAMVFVNAMYAVVIGVGLWIVGVPNAPLWGVFAGLLRFVPYLGIWIGAVAPVALSIAVFDGWSRTIAVLVLVLGTDLLAGNVVEPRVYGKKTGLSPLAVVVASVFWTWTWGIPGLLLALPMTLCLAVAGRYVPGLEFLDVLLGDAPPLGPAERVYERLAALDPDGARRVAQEGLASAGIETTYDDVLLGALRLASVGRRLGVLADARFHDLCVGLLEATDGLAIPSRPEDRPGVAGRVLCLPAGDDADRVACELLARLLAARGVDVEVGNPTAMSGEVAVRVESESARVVCVASIPPLAAPRVRYLVQRIRGRVPAARILAAIWDPACDRATLTARMTDAGADHVAFTLHDALEVVRRLLAEAATPPAEASPGAAAKPPT